MKSRRIREMEIRQLKKRMKSIKPGDVILVAGKGHEDYQEVKGVKHHFDDKEEVRACFGA